MKPLPALDVRLVTSKRFHRRELKDAFDNFENRETTVSHVFRLPHPFLDGRRYGEAFHDALKRMRVGGEKPVWEIGGGVGYFAEAFLSAAGRTRRYTITDLAPELVRSQRKVIEGAFSGKNARRVHWVLSDGESLPYADHSLDGTIIANEMIADLDAWVVKPRSRGRAGSIRISGREKIDPKEVRRQLARFGFNFAQSKGRRAIFPVGFVALLDRLRRAMAPEATAVITEYFDPGNLGHISRMHKHAELAISLPMACHIVERCGFVVQVVSLLDFLDLQVDAPVVVQSLRSLAKEFLGKEFSHTLPAQEQMLARLARDDSYRRSPEFYDRAELLRFVSQFYALILKKRPELSERPIGPELVMRREPGVLEIAEKDGTPALVKVRPFRLRRINETGSEIWRLIDGKRSVGAIAGRLARTYGISRRTALKDTLQFMRVLDRDRMACRI